jgi:hypothetical protein
MLMEMYDRERPEFPETTDLIEEQRRQAVAAAMMQIGAGIASDADDMGLSSAQQAVTAGMDKANELDAKSRFSKFEAAQGEIDRDIDLLAKAAGLDISAARSRIMLQIQQDENINGAWRTASSMAEAVAANIYDPAQKAQVMARVMKAILPADIASNIDFRSMIGDVGAMTEAERVKQLYVPKG